MKSFGDIQGILLVITNCNNINTFGGQNMVNWMELFDAWQNDCKIKVFVLDGVTEKSTYFDEKIKVLFLLKDLNLVDKSSVNEKGQVDMRKGCFDKEDWRTWNGVALWGKAFTLEAGPTFEKFKDSVMFREKYLPKISFMNIKKEAGKECVSNKEIKAYSMDCVNRKYLLEEVRCLEPDIIITCGTFEAAKIIFGAEDDLISAIELGNGGWRKTIRWFKVNDLLDVNKTVYVVEYRHPCMASYKKCYGDMYDIKSYFGF